tara:strand:- start:89 stop:454 length:366 start_codon:yes stop_codon:yes gene_type:complete
MPSQRRRIGFLPRAEVQIIINKICDHNKLSQSKVTGILVEEALTSRGMLNNSIKELSFDFSFNTSETPLTANKIFNSEISNDEHNINLDEDYIKDEVQMINDFIEFKFFKNIMIRNKRKIK